MSPQHTAYSAILGDEMLTALTVIALEILPAHANHWARYTINILLVGYPYLHPILGI